MVYFSCDACAEVLKKNQVDNHARRCRGCDAVSCVDCLVSFYGGKSIKARMDKMMNAWWREKKPVMTRNKPRMATQNVSLESCKNVLIKL